MARIVADRDRCAGSGMCALTAPEHFDQGDEDGLVLVLVEEAGDGDTEVADAVQLCPAGALGLK
jgi:ferredoxin